MHLLFACNRVKVSRFSKLVKLVMSFVGVHVITSCITSTIHTFILILTLKTRTVTLQ